MTIYKETTLTEFQEALKRHDAGEKSGITVCYRGLSQRDRREARTMIRYQFHAEGSMARAAQQRLDIPAVRAHQTKAAVWGELLDRFLTIP